MPHVLHLQKVREGQKGSVFLASMFLVQFPSKWKKGFALSGKTCSTRAVRRLIDLEDDGRFNPVRRAVSVGISYR